MQNLYAASAQGVESKAQDRVVVVVWPDGRTEQWWIDVFGDWSPVDMMPPPWVQEEGPEYD